jgi:hypothetical protein
MVTVVTVVIEAGGAMKRGGFDRRAGVAALVLLFSVGCDPSEGDQAGECLDQVDNDLDGQTDCDDPGCEIWIACADWPAPPPREPNCADPQLHPGTLTVTTEAEADAVCASFDAIGGDLILSPEAATSFDLGGLSCLCEVHGSLDLRIPSGTQILDMPFLAGVAGDLTVRAGDALALISLRDLGAVGGDLSIHGGASLVEVRLDNLQQIGGTLRLEGAGAPTGLELRGLGGLLEAGAIEVTETSLEEFDGSGIEEIARGIELRGNPALSVIRLESVRELDGSLLLEAMPALSVFDLSGLEQTTGSVRLEDLGGLSVLRFDSLEEVDGDVVIHGVGNIESLDDLSALTDVGGGLHVTDCPYLQHLDGLDSLEDIDGDFILEDNPLLFDLDGLDNLDQIGGSLRIVGNEVLPEGEACDLILSIGLSGIDGGIELPPGWCKVR